MSENIRGVPIIYPEPDGKCELCGAIAETRPYGPNGERICHPCGMKDEETTERMMGIKLFGETPEEAARMAEKIKAARASRSSPKAKP